MLIHFGLCRRSNSEILLEWFSFARTAISYRRFDPKHIKLMIAPLVLLTVLWSKSSYATDYYVSPSGSDSNPGTEQLPFRNPQAAANVVNPGDTVFLMDGTYPGVGSDKRVLNLSRSGTPGNMITFRNYPGHRPQIGRLPPTKDDQYGFVLLGADNIRIEGLAFVGTEQKCLYIASNGINGSTNVEIIDNTFDQCGRAFVTNTLSDCQVDTGHDSINSGPYTNGTLIEGNVITNSGRTINTELCQQLGSTNDHEYRHDHAMYLKGANHIVRNNVILDHPAGLGIKIDGYSQNIGEISAPFYSHIIINNTFGPNVSPQPYDGSSGHPVNPFNSSNAIPGGAYNPRYLIANNIFLEPINGTGGGAYTGSVLLQSGQTWPGTPDCYNNISTGTKVQSTCSEHLAEFAVNVTSVDNVINETLGNLEFIDAPNDNYEIGATSSAIGAGNCAISAITGDGRNAIPSTDFNGNPRSPTTCDVGAFEHSSQQASRPMPPAFVNAN